MGLKREPLILHVNLCDAEHVVRIVETRGTMRVQNYAASRIKSGYCRRSISG